MPLSGPKFIDIVVDCPECGQREALPRMAVDQLLVDVGYTRYLTVGLSDIPRVDHECRRGNTENKMAVAPQVAAERDFQLLGSSRPRPGGE